MYDYDVSERDCRCHSVQNFDLTLRARETLNAAGYGGREWSLVSSLGQNRKF